MRSPVRTLLVYMFFAIFLPAYPNLFAQSKVVREIGSFDKVKISDKLRVSFRKSDKEKITIVASGIDYDKIVTKSSGRELNIGIKTGIYKDSEVNVEVEYVKIRSVIASNKADVKFNDILTGDELTLKATGGAVINIEVSAAAVKASVSQSGRIEISGKAELQEVDASLGAKYNAYEFETENGFVKANTKAGAVVWVKNRLEATAGSKAELKYRGKPVEVKSSTNLGGKISGDL